MLRPGRLRPGLPLPVVVTEFPQEVEEEVAELLDGGAGAEGSQESVAGLSR